MQAYDVYKDISERTGGDIYIGVVGAVRTGKSTFIRNMMDLLVLPRIQDEYENSVLPMNCRKAVQDAR